LERNFLLLILLNCSLLYSGEQFVFSAKAISRNHTLFYDEIRLSPLMQEREKTSHQLCILPRLEPLHVSTQAFLKSQEERLLECLLAQGVLVHDWQEHTTNLGASQTQLRVLPVRFTVEFKDDFVTLYLLAP